VGIVLVSKGFECQYGQEIFLFFRMSRPAVLPSQPPIQWVLGFFPGVERPGREVNHSPPSSDDVKNEWSFTYTDLICFRSVDKENFILHC
jgi:hypothetical protein